MTMRGPDASQAWGWGPPRQRSPARRTARCAAISPGAAWRGRAGRLVLLGVLALPVAATATVDLAALWDFGNPALSEQRFREALAAAERDGRRDDALILQTQVARTLG